MGLATYSVSYTLLFGSGLVIYEVAYLVSNTLSCQFGKNVLSFEGGKDRGVDYF